MKQASNGNWRWGILLALPIVLGVDCSSAEQTSMVDLVNYERVAHGIAKLSVDVNLNVLADQWAAHMAHEVQNDVLSDPATWCQGEAHAELVKDGASIQANFDDQKDDASSLAKMLDTGYKRIGAGYEKGHDGKVYTVWRFCGGTTQEPPPPPPPPTSCGDHTCNGTETCSTCEHDCGVCQTPPPPAGCGDHVCNGSETCSNCEHDCGVCPPTGNCGDNTCNGGETCSTCASDCGSCPVLTQPPADNASDSSGGRLRITCDVSHMAQVDPIVAPNMMSAHMHSFAGNHLTSADPSYSRMIAGTTSCNFSKDTAAYWVPPLKAPNGQFVAPTQTIFYYRARPVGYVHGTIPFPANFKMIAGGVGTPDNSAYWTCKGESDTGYPDRKLTIPNCTGVQEQKLEAHVFFPSCWDGRLDSPDHRAHVAYGLKDGKPNGTNPKTCPASHPYKIPQIDVRFVYDIKDGRGYTLSDGQQIPHMDFWNTWQQPSLEKLVNDCLRTGKNCDEITD